MRTIDHPGFASSRVLGWCMGCFEAGRPLETFYAHENRWTRFRFNLCGAECVPKLVATFCRAGFDTIEKGDFYADRLTTRCAFAVGTLARVDWGALQQTQPPEVYAECVRFRQTE